MVPRWRRIAIAVAWVLVVLAAIIDWRVARVSTPPLADGTFKVSHSTVGWARAGSASTINAEVWAPASNTKLPLLLFSPGLGQTPTAYSILLHNIASHGYLIVAVAHDTSIEDDAHFTAIAESIGRELSVVLDSISVATVPSLLASADLNRVGAFGHSIGGAAAAIALYNDARFKAGIDFDGTVFGEPVTRGIRQPFMLVLAKLTIFDGKPDGPPEFLPENDQLRVHEDSLMAHSPNAVRVTVDGLRHMNFADQSFDGDVIARLPEAVGLRVSPPTTIRMAVWYVTHFFAGATKEELKQAPFGAAELR